MTKPADEAILFDRLSYLWLAIAIVLLPFVYGVIWVIPIAAWIAPLLMLRFMRTQKPSWGIYIGALVHITIYIIIYIPVVASVVSPLAYMQLLLITAATGFSAFIPYIADRLLARRLKGITSTLVFPLTWVIVEYIRSSFLFAGTVSVTAYSQYYNLPLIQIVSVTGLWGLSFLIVWFAAVANTIWENGFSVDLSRQVSRVYLAVLVTVLLFGGARLAFSSNSAQTVRVAAVPRIEEAGTLESNLRSIEALTREAAQAGAKVVVFYEAGLTVEYADKADLLASSQTLAHEEDVYLLLGLDVGGSTPGERRQNKTVLITPSGEVEWEYEKRYLALEEMPGYSHREGTLLVSSTEYGVVSSAICNDANFPAHMRQPDADIMLVPAWQTLAVDNAVRMISRMFYFRAIENGYAIVIPIYHGWTLAADPQGRVLAAYDFFSSSQSIAYADVPTEGVWTLYSVLGDWFAWLSIAGFVAILVWVAVQHRSV